MTEFEYDFDEVKRQAAEIERELNRTQPISSVPPVPPVPTPVAAKVSEYRPPAAVRNHSWADYITPTEYPFGVRRGSYLLSLFAVALVLIVHHFLLGTYVADTASGRLSQYETVEFWSRLGGLGATFPVALYLYTYSRRLRTPGAWAVIRTDDRPPVLLLRAFQDDYAEIDNAAPWLDWRGVWARFGAERTHSFEEIVENLFGRCGPVVAIGRPGEPVPPLGAARFWIGDDRWQAAIEHLLDASQRVVLIMGQLQDSEGLKWEVRQVFDLTQPDKVVFLMPPVDEADARERWQAYRELSNGRLPEYEEGVLAVGFDPDGTARVVRANRRWGVIRRDESAYRSAIQVPPPSRRKRFLLISIFTIFFGNKILSDLLPTVQMVRESAGRQVAAENLKRIGLALHRQDATNPLVPSSIILQNPAILPFLDLPQLPPEGPPAAVSPFEIFGVRVDPASEYEIRRFDLPPGIGLSIRDVVSNSPAQASNLRPGLVITEFQGEPVSNVPEQFARRLSTVLASRPDQFVFITHDTEEARRIDRMVRYFQIALWTVGGGCLFAIALLVWRGSPERTTGNLDFRQPVRPAAAKR